MSQVYANILETLTSGLYNEINFAIREYLQNAYDAIKAAKKISLKIPQDGFYVDVKITRNNSIISIFDNGIGMDEKVLREYTSIGGGTKNDAEFAGHKGIGKLSGLRFFEKFVVRTKTAKEKSGYELSWECGRMMNVLLNEKERMKKISYTEFIKEFFTIKRIETEEEDAHYTQIQLINVLDEFAEQISEDKIGMYIKINCPVPFHGEYFSFTNQIEKWVEKDISFAQTFINGKIIYQVYNNKHNLIEPNFIEIRYEDKLRAKTWFSWVKNVSGSIEADEIRGMRFRCKGICVGDSKLFANNCMPPGRDTNADWFTGEVVVVDDGIRPSAARDRFYEGSASRKLYQELTKKVGKELSFIATVRSELNAAEQDAEAIKRLKKEGKDTAKQLNKIKDRISKLDRYRRRNRYDLDFKIISTLDSMLKEDKERILKKVKQTEKDIEKDVKENDKKELVDKLLDFKKEEVQTSSQEAKKALRKRITEVKDVLTSEKGEENEVINEKIIPSKYVELIVDVIYKYLMSKKQKCDEAEIRDYLKNELDKR